MFGLNATDAKDMAAMAPELEALDFMTLPRYEVYTNFMADGKATGWIRGKTIPPMDSLRHPVGIRALSQITYGVPAEEVDEEFLRLIEKSEEESLTDFDDTTIGRRKT